MFNAALERPAEERAPFLDEACGLDAELRREVAAMLAAHDDDQGLMLERRLLSDDEPSPVSGDDVTDERIGQRIGVYRLKRLLGKGGMGAVYLAERDDSAYEQEVALKLVKPGLQSEEIVGRFRTERQILARLRHPNIARLLDGGVTQDGLPYLVMDHVDGVPITDYCRSHNLQTQDRLHLFEKVCRAVQFAHRNLVVHRDLKPLNILVTPEGEVKLLDFGIAKLLDPDDGIDSIPNTRPEVRLMTPDYASPEQVRGETITTATDVYALGVLLYELVAGDPPYQLRGLGRTEVERVVCEDVPPPPSAKEPAVDPDLDNVVMMALRKEPERRYASVDQFADDVVRYREGRPVQARKSTVGYRVSRFVRRHRAGVLTAVLAGVLASAAAFAYVRTVQGERDRAEEARADAEQTVAFLEGFFASADPFETERRDTMRVAELLDRAAASLTTELAGQPSRQARLYTVLGRSYAGLGRYADADSLLRLAMAASEDDPARHSDAGQSLGDVLNSEGASASFEEARLLLTEVLDERVQRLGEDHAVVAATRNSLAFALARLGSFEEAELEYRRVMEYHRRSVPADSGELAFVTKNLALALSPIGELEEAEALLRESVALRRAYFGEGHPNVAIALQSLAGLLRNSQRRDEALAPAREALAIREQALGARHPHTLASRSTLGSILRGLGELDEAADVLGEVIVHIDAAAPEVSYEFPGFPVYLNDYANLLVEMKRYRDAEMVAQRSLVVNRERFGDQHRGTGVAMSRLAAVARGEGDHARAVRFHRGAIQRFDAFSQAPNLFSAFERAAMARSLSALGQRDAAESALVESRDMLVAMYGEGHAQVVRAEERLAEMRGE